MSLNSDHLPPQKKKKNGKIDYHREERVKTRNKVEREINEEDA